MIRDRSLTCSGTLKGAHRVPNLSKLKLKRFAQYMAVADCHGDAFGQQIHCGLRIGGRSNAVACHPCHERSESDHNYSKIVERATVGRPVLVTHSPRVREHFARASLRRFYEGICKNATFFNWKVRRAPLLQVKAEFRADFIEGVSQRYEFSNLSNLLLNLVHHCSERLSRRNGCLAICGSKLPSHPKQSCSGYSRRQDVAEQALIAVEPEFPAAKEHDVLLFRRLREPSRLAKRRLQRINCADDDECHHQHEKTDQWPVPRAHCTPPALSILEQFGARFAIGRCA